MFLEIFFTAAKRRLTSLTVQNVSCMYKSFSGPFVNTKRRFEVRDYWCCRVGIAASQCEELTLWRKYSLGNLLLLLPICFGYKKPSNSTSPWRYMRGAWMQMGPPIGPSLGADKQAVWICTVPRIVLWPSDCFIMTSVFPPASIVVKPWLTGQSGEI